MNNPKLHYMDALGIQTWQLRSSEISQNVEICSPTETLNEPQTDVWNTLHANIALCTACGLNKTRTQPVFGVGNRQARLMIIGEAPGFYEDKAGEPFVGRAGQLLNAMLQSINIKREEVYIANILKCRPPNNRDPLPNEVELCTPFLKKQIALVNPTLLLGLGRIAAHYLLNTKTSLGKLRGQLMEYNNIPLLITYHPAYLLRNPSDKRKTFEDLQLVVKMLDRHSVTNS
jgi:DNA polymerase